MSKCEFIYRYGGPRCPYPCVHEAEFRVYAPGQGIPKLCCADHLVLMIYDFVGLCVVVPIMEGEDDARLPAE